MAKEIERKFLIKKDLWQPCSEGVEIAQGYLSLDIERTVRVRIKGDKGYLTIKGKNSGISRTELEYEIPKNEARQLLDELCIKPLLEKRRYVESIKGQQWEIDVFTGDNAGLIVAEAELASEEAALELPAWIDKEVSVDSRYYNSSLIQKPYKNWSL